LAGGGTYRTLDSVTGTFSSYPSLVLLTILSIGLLLNHKLETNKDLFKINSYYLLVFLITPLILSKSRTGTGLVLFMIMFVFIWSAIRKKTNISIIKLISLMSTLVFLTGVLFYNFFWKTNYNIKIQLSPDYIVSYFMRETKILRTGKTTAMGRARAVYEASKLISKNHTTMLIGRGMGSVTESRLLGMRGRYFADFGSLVGIGRTQVSKVIAENGIVGFFLFLFLFYSMWQQIHRIKVNKETLQSSYIIILLSIFLLSLYMPVFQAQYFSILPMPLWRLSDLQQVRSR